MQNHACAFVLLICTLAVPAVAQRRVPNDLSGVRGFNYEAAENMGQLWLQYDPVVTERDLGYAKRLKLNQARVFVPYDAWERDKVSLRKNLLHLVRAAHERGIVHRRLRVDEALLQRELRGAAVELLGQFALRPAAAFPQFTKAGRQIPVIATEDVRFWRARFGGDPSVVGRTVRLDDVPHEINVVIEIPMNSDPIKYELDKESGQFRLDRVLFSAVHYPGDYGLIPRTLHEDHDPLDIIVSINDKVISRVPAITTRTWMSTGPAA